MNERKTEEEEGGKEEEGGRQGQRAVDGQREEGKKGGSENENCIRRDTG